MKVLVAVMDIEEYSLCLQWQAGQVYGVPLTGSLLSKPGAYPELRQCGEDFKKKWIEV